MIYLIHGDNLVASRNFLKELVDLAKEKKQEIVRLEGSKIAIEDLIQALAPRSLFASDRLIVIENLFTRPKSKELDQIFNFLKSFREELDLVFWEKKEIGKILQRSLPPKTAIKLFKTPVLVFKFLDQVTPQTKNQALQTLQELYKLKTDELIFYMLVRQFRLLLLIRFKQQIAGPVWVVGKLKRQAEAFSQSKLLTIYRRLFNIDESVKTGRSLMSLSWHLDMLISSL